MGIYDGNINLPHKLDISGVKGFFNKVQLSVSDTSQKELFAVSGEYELLTN